MIPIKQIAPYSGGLYIQYANDDIWVSYWVGGKQVLEQVRQPDYVLKEAANNE